jgi:uncharacterized protein (DUF983 family)
MSPAPQNKPNLFHALRLRCPHCGKTALLRAGHFLEFGVGCEPCNYKYEREIGYFSGASWMMNYTFASLMAMLAGGYMVWKHSDAGDLIVAGIPALFGAVAAFVFIPWGRSLWMWIDHKLHPLTEADKLNP